MSDKKHTVLLVEDDLKLNKVNKMVLEVGGYEVLTAETLADARAQLNKTEPDIILLDVMLPDGNGFDFCREYRGKTDAHIIFLTGKADDKDYERGLTDGGDDYLTKPFNPDRLFHKMQSVMRRRKVPVNPTSPDVLVKGSLTISRRESKVFLDGTDLAINKIDFEMLYVLALSEGEVVPSEELYQKAWGRPMAGDKSALRQAKYRVCSLTEPAGYTVRNVYGKGYVFEKL